MWSRVAIAALFALGLRQCAIAAPSPAASCKLDRPLIFTTRQFTDGSSSEARLALAQESARKRCVGSLITTLGQQSYTPLEVDEPEIVDVWHARQEGEQLQWDQEFVYAFLAWQAVDEGFQNDSKYSWAHRIQALFGSGAQEEKSTLTFQNGYGPASSFEATDNDALDELLNTLDDRAEAKLASLRSSVTLLNLERTFAVVRVASLTLLSDLSVFLPRDTRLARLLPIALSTNNRVVNLPKPRYIPPLHALTFSTALSEDALRADARTLTGEDESSQRRTSESDTIYWHSRHSATYGAHAAAAWIRERMERDLSPLGANCQKWPYDPEYAPNVVCTIPADETKTSARRAKEGAMDDGVEADGMLLFSSHLDSRGSFGSTLAPGGNDDGSGTTMLLALARHLGRHKITFSRTVQLVAFSGEEQGLVGSQHYARHLQKTKQPVYFQLQTDMIGYRKPGEPMQAGFPDKLATQAATDYVMAIAQIYVPELQLGYTPACCSDHQSFWETGVTSTWIFERRGPIADDRYHNSLDITNRTGYDFEQLRASTRVVLATLLDLGEAVPWPYV